MVQPVKPLFGMSLVQILAIVVLIWTPMILADRKWRRTQVLGLCPPIGRAE